MATRLIHIVKKCKKYRYKNKHRNIVFVYNKFLKNSQNGYKILKCFKPSVIRNGTS